MKKIVKKILILSLLTILVACSTAQDQCLRRELFENCIKTTGDLSKNSVYFDLSEFVRACDTSSWNLSWRNKKMIKPECKYDD